MTWMERDSVIHGCDESSSDSVRLNGPQKLPKSIYSDIVRTPSGTNADRRQGATWKGVPRDLTRHGHLEQLHFLLFGLFSSTQQCPEVVGIDQG